MLYGIEPYGIPGIEVPGGSDEMAEALKKKHIQDELVAHLPMDDSRQKPVEAVRAGMLDPTRATSSESIKDLKAVFANPEANAKTWNEWLTPAFLGPDLAARKPKQPPVIGTETPQYFHRFEKDNGYPVNGVHVWGASSIEISMKVHEPANRYRVIVHEQLHYASELGGGQNIRWPGENGKMVGAGYVPWLHEGLTELYAQRLSREHGMEPTSVAYPFETSACLYMENILVKAAGDRKAGQEILRNAYLSGDFTQVRLMVDSALGPGSFEKLLKQENGYRALARNKGAALDYLKKRGQDSFIRGGPSYGIEEDPIAKAISSQTTMGWLFSEVKK
jgi:hypothetical protein